MTSRIARPDQAPIAVAPAFLASAPPSPDNHGATKSGEVWEPMRASTHGSLTATALPTAALLAAAAAIVYTGHGLPTSASSRATLSTIAWATLVAAALLGLRFRRPRVGFAAALLGGQLALQTLAPSAPWVHAALDGAAWLIPLNLAWLGLGRERNILSLRGALRATALAAQVTALWYLSHRDPAHLHSLSRAPLADQIPHGATLPVPPGALAVYALAAVGLLATWLRRRSTVDMALLGTTVASLWALWVGRPLSATLFVTAAGAVLLVGVLEASYGFAFRDALTQLPSRRALDEELDRVGGRYALAMIDIDHFKGFNDRYGHDVGDQVLRLVARELGAAPGGGRAYRYGGEEFTVLYPGRTAADVMPHAEALRARVEAARLTLRAPSRPKKKPRKASKKRAKTSTRKAKQVSVTISVGVADASRAGDEGPTAVIKAADKAMYKAKRTGRNRVVS